MAALDMMPGGEVDESGRRQWTEAALVTEEGMMAPANERFKMPPLGRALA